MPFLIHKNTRDRSVHPSLCPESYIFPSVTRLRTSVGVFAFSFEDVSRLKNQKKIKKSEKCQKKEKFTTPKIPRAPQTRICALTLFFFSIRSYGIQDSHFVLPFHVPGFLCHFFFVSFSLSFLCLSLFLCFQNPLSTPHAGVRTRACGCNRMHGVTR
ncbi:uncharacterized protein YALI1_D08594g [Yarrowia lipolytica]|uniref:Transmembrane protein n=1 Tax=Yarrowia lipolytica TaxID=4952 RepID=A0A1D8NDI5_YARLL|nr:hypothetical protein YALI1_D08594g [Yarrowia lipolytica]